MIKAGKPIDVLINNAGVFCDTNKFSADGYELTIGVNYLGQVLLTEMLLPLLKGQSHARIINVSSEAALFGKIKMTDDLFTKPSKGIVAYSKSKLAQLLFNIYLAEKLKPDNITVNAVHPGKVATNIWQGDSLMMKIIGPMNMKKYMRPQQAAEICVEVALQDQYRNETGQFFKAEGRVVYNKRCLDRALSAELMKATYKELGLE